MKLTLQILVIALLFAGSERADAHARWKLGSTISAPRSDDPGLKTAPCGDKPRTKLVRYYAPAETATVEFEETVNHPGRFEVYLLGENDQPLAGVPSPLATLTDNQNESVIGGKFHQYTISFQIPAVECTACAFQLVQVMTDDPQNPSNYYSCTDVAISAKVPEKPSGFKIQRRK